MTETNALSPIIAELIKLIVPVLLTALVTWITSKLAPGVKAWIEANVDARERTLITMIFDLIARSTEAARLRALMQQAEFDAVDYATGLAEDALGRYGIALDRTETKNEILAALHRLRSELMDIHVVPGSGVSTEIDAKTTGTVLPFNEGDEPSTRGLSADPATDPAMRVLKFESQRVRGLMWL